MYNKYTRYVYSQRRDAPWHVSKTPQPTIATPTFPPVTHRVTPPKYHTFTPKLPYFWVVSMGVTDGEPQGCETELLEY